MTEQQTPTERELDILKILWAEGESTVRQVYEVIREQVPIVQNTVQAMLRTMEEKGLVAHRTDGRAFVYRPTANVSEQREKWLASFWILHSTELWTSWCNPCSHIASRMRKSCSSCMS